MNKVVDAVYEDGVFKPLNKIDLAEHEKFRLTISYIEELKHTDQEFVKRQKKALMNIAGIGDSGLGDVSENHDKYLYDESIKK